MTMAMSSVVGGVLISAIGLGEYSRLIDEFPMRGQVEWLTRVLRRDLPHLELYRSSKVMRQTTSKPGREGRGVAS